MIIKVKSFTFKCAARSAQRAMFEQAEESSVFWAENMMN